MPIVLGIDPGSRITGYGIIQVSGTETRYLDSGCIRMGEQPMALRLQTIYRGLTELVAQYKPDECAIEQVFLARNADSALKLGQARGAAMVAASNADLLVYEYSARQVKQAVVGKGSADKAQVQHMVQVILKLSRRPQADAADALGIALCHAHMQRGITQLGTQGRVRRGRLQN